MGGVRNRDAEEDWGLEFKPRHCNYAGGTLRLWVLPLPHSLGSWKARCSSDAELSLSSLEECRRDIVGRKGVKELLLVGQEKVPCGFVLRTGDSGNTANGAGNRGRPAT